MASTGSLGDYLGLPTTLFGKYGTVGEVTTTGCLYSVKGNQFGGSSEFTYLSGVPVNSLDNYLSFHNLTSYSPSLSTLRANKNHLFSLFSTYFATLFSLSQYNMVYSTQRKT